ncbi:hypothetical protein [Nostoc sp.]|uniref:hypothetical protein n=1 Tax=Nostoc sp. TaxID=1180 RepID=UPI002FF8CE9B
MCLPISKTRTTIADDKLTNPTGLEIGADSDIYISNKGFVAGLSAALLLGRGRRRVLVCDKRQSAQRFCTRVAQFFHPRRHQPARTFEHRAQPTQTLQKRRISSDHHRTPKKTQFSCTLPVGAPSLETYVILSSHGWSVTLLYVDSEEGTSGGDNSLVK